MEPTAIAERGRIAVLDALRGVALLGIVLVNIEWFSRPWQEAGDGLMPDLQGADHAVALLLHVLVSGKFWILFSLLFGMGFAVFMSRAEAAGRPGTRLYLRRLAVLAALGLAHALLVWNGDILFAYALAALLLPAMRALQPTIQLLTGMALYIGLALSTLAVGGLLMLVGENGSVMGWDAPESVARAVQAYAHGGFAEVTRQRIEDFSVMGWNNVAMAPAALGIFLVGTWLLRTGRMVEPALLHRRFHLRLVLLGWTPGLVLTALGLAFGESFPDPDDEARSIVAMSLHMLGALPMALGWLGLLMLAWQSRAGRWLMDLFAPAGRMALSNYLAQSLVASLLFYGYGMGLWGQLGYARMILLALAIFVVQAVFSHLWMAWFRFGPLEWLWRWATYGARPPMRRERGIARNR